MKAAAVYYSLEGNTRFVAQRIAERTGAELFELKPKQAYPTGAFSKFFWGGKSSTFEEKPELEQTGFRAENYDIVFVGTPLWAWKIAPPLRTFLAENELKNQKVAAFICSGGGNASRAFASIRTATGHAALEGELALPNALKTKESAEEKIDAFCKNVMGK